MLPLAAAPAVIAIKPVSLDAWRWQIEAMGWTWRATSADRRVEVFTQAVKDTPAPQLWVRTERFDGQWQSQTAKVAVDCASGQVSVVEDQLLRRHEPVGRGARRRPRRLDPGRPRAEACSSERL